MQKFCLCLVIRYHRSFIPNEIPNWGIISFDNILVTSLVLLVQAAIQKMCQLKPIGIIIPLVEVSQKNLMAYKLQDSFLFL